MIIKEASLETVCGITSVLPRNLYPEIAFCGKSNVGKSSLINALLNRKSLARTSASPGKTQTINFYRVLAANKADKSDNTEALREMPGLEFYFVDLPGYGYANVSIEIKQKWGKMIEKYLNFSQKLKCIFLLIDIRHKPSENDKLMYNWVVGMGFKPVLVATKLDKIKRSAVSKNISIIKQELNTAHTIIPFSAGDKRGREEIYALICKLLGE